MGGCFVRSKQLYPFRKGYKGYNAVRSKAPDFTFALQPGKNEEQA
jgi:hypothetical protein